MSNNTIRRRDFLGKALVAAAYSTGGLFAQTANGAKDQPATHNWMLVGSRTAFLSHLPMFDHLNDSGTDYVTPHRYQAILQVTFDSAGKDVTNLYLAERQNHPDTKMFTVSPAEQFVLSDLAAAQSITSFDATVFRGHLERGGEPISKLDPIKVKVAKVIHFHKFQPAADAATGLEYFLFGRGDELFVAHAISKPPDFDQIMSVEISGAAFSGEDLNSAIGIRMPSRQNTAHNRLHEGEQVSAELASGAKLNVKGVREFYFEEGELLIPATFRPTPEEIKAGFTS